jgi:membrane protein required for colicin V production
MDLAWVDLALLGLLVLSTIVGLMRGLVFEVLSLVGWVVSYFAAQWLTPQMSHRIPVGAEGSLMNHLATFALMFFGVLLLWGMCAWLIKRLVRASVISGADRLMGAVFGLARGVLMAWVIATFVAWTPLAQSAPWRESHGAVMLLGVLEGLKPLMPAVLAQRLP